MATGDDFQISDQAMQIYSWVVYGAVCQIINIFGIVTNIINIICFSKQGFEDSVNISLLGLSVSDLGSLITMAWTALCLSQLLMDADLSFDPLEVAYLTSGSAHFSFTRVSSCITAMITLERCLCITAPLKIKSVITPKRVALITVCLFVVFFFSGSAVYAVNTLGLKYFPRVNKTIIGVISTDEREQVEMMSIAINNFSIPFIAFVIVLICTIILAFKLRRQSKWRKDTINSTQMDKVSSRNQKAANMVVLISSVFIVCFVPVCIGMLAAAFLPELVIGGKYMYITLMFAGFAYIMESINSSMNICIYYRMSSKYRRQFCRLFGINERTGNA